MWLCEYKTWIIKYKLYLKGNSWIRKLNNNFLKLKILIALFLSLKIKKMFRDLQ